MNLDNGYIGKSLQNVEGVSKVTGATRYTTDLHFDNMAWAYPVYSTVPSGKISAIDTTAARQVEGFIDVILADRIPGDNQVGVIIEDQPLLADSQVRFIGDVIGIAVAETSQAARLAASKVVVSYEETESLFTIEDSQSATGDFIHHTNVACSHRVIKGNLDEGFANSDLIVETEFTTHSQEHYYLEPQACIAFPEDDGQIVIKGSLQCPYYIQKAVAKAMAIPLDKVRVIQAPVGGAFGGKEDIPSELGARLALAASSLNRPVKMVYDRADDVQLTSKRHAFHMRYKIGVMNDGKLNAAQITLKSNAGAYATLSPVVSYRSTMQAMGPYVVPHIQVNSTACYTNLPPAGAFRGFGSPQVAFAHERMLDIIAAKLGMDPVDLRLKNVIEIDAETITSHRLSTSVGARETIQRAVESANVGNGDLPPDDQRYLIGTGMGTAIYGNCLGAAGWHMDGAGVYIKIMPDGLIEVNFGLTEMGQGALTAVTQMTAEALGVDHGRISVLATDTKFVPDSGPSVASRNVVMSGNAIRDAAAKLLPVLKSAAAELLECDEKHITIQGDMVTDTKSGAQTGFTELAEYLFHSGRPTEISGWWHVPELKYDADTGQGEAYFTYSYATQIAKVKVDTLTGLVTVLDVWAAHDVGKVINPAGFTGQVEGGVVQALGWALTENLQTDQGVVATTNLSTYLVPTANDAPNIHAIAVEDPEPIGPWGAKGVGEPAFIPTAAAIANAVSNAIGAHINELPITPENVLTKIEGRSNKA